MTTAPGGEIEGGFSRRVLGWVIGIAVASFLGAILLSAYGDRAGSWPSPHANTFSYSAIGHRGLVELLRSFDLGVVSRQTRGTTGAGPGRPLVLAEPDVDHDPAAARLHLMARRHEALGAGAPLVLVLPKWRGAPQRRHPGWIGGAALRDRAELEPLLATLPGAAPPPTSSRAPWTLRRGAAAVTCTARAETGEIRFALDANPTQLFSPDLLPRDVDALVTCGAGILVARSTTADPADPGLYLISDPDILNNQGLARGDHAALVHYLFVDRLHARGVVFDETIHGFLRSESLLAEAFRLPLLPATLQACVLLAVVLWAGMGRFGKPLPVAPALAPGKEVLIDNTAALLTYGGHAADSLARYYRQTLRGLAAALYLPADLSEEALRQRLEEIARRRGARADLAALARQVERLAGDRDAARQAAGVAARLHRWRREMTDGHRADP